MDKKYFAMNNRAKIEENSIYNYNLYKAQNTLWYFNNLINNCYNDTAIKFMDSNNVYVWMENVKIEGDYYTGELAENGNAHKVPINDVIDWMVIEDGRLIGGYTIRHYRNTLDDEAKMNFDIDFGVKIDAGNDFFKPDLTTPEGAIIKIEIFYTEENLEGVISCKDFEMEAENMLKDSDLELTESTKNDLAEVLKLALIEDIKSNGFPHFNNIERNFSLITEQQDQKLIEETIIFENDTTKRNKFWIGQSKSGDWKVLNLVE
ncbi:DUF2314 domain-containing protein [Chryseobacterium shigense]|uniref:DUF2314 domain-containing protein n=1 Tax=Chryseobacterium shigense TaxID=297244 RepID=A0A841NHI4_9FLAO|nr:DUF2314 domain-containing protein [Chryseobacterium shigense]MBB6370769.1 hypothetical protein [Chryseobacterium shigense]